MLKMRDISVRKYINLLSDHAYAFRRNTGIQAQGKSVRVLNEDESKTAPAKTSEARNTTVDTNVLFSSSFS